MKKTKLLAALLLCTAVSLNAQGIAATHDTNVSEVINQTYDGYVTQGDGGAISNTISSIIKESTFKNNRAENNGAGGALDLNTKSDMLTQIINSHFDNNYSNYEGGAIAQRRNSGSLEIIGGSYTNNSAEYEGGALFLGSNANVTSSINNVLFEGNKTLSTNFNDKYSTADDGGGGAIFVGSKANVNVSNAIFNKNISNTVGGAIAVRNDSKNDGSNSLTVTNSTFTGNEALKDGGAIASYIDFNVSDTTFEGNIAGRNGGAVLINLGNPNAEATKGSTFNNVVFSNNQAIGIDSFGGAMFIAGKADVDIANSQFSGNKADWYGAISNTTKGGFTNISDTTFSNNEAKAGGAIGNFAGRNKNSGMIIKNTTFTANKATDSNDDGGGAMLLGAESKTTILNTIFKDNNSKTIGGAIATRDYIKGNNSTAKLDIDGAIFTNNKADGKGGAIYNAFYNSESIPDTVSIKNSTFSGNSSGADGGAIYNEIADKAGNFATVAITDTDFVNNTAAGKGGAIYANADLSVSAVTKDVVMAGNKAADGGDIFMSKESSNLNLNAQEGKSITVASGISGNENGYNVLVNSNGGTGSLIVNSAIQNAAINVQNGTFQLGQNAVLVDSDLTMATGSTFNSINGRIDSADNIARGDSSVTFADGTNIAADVNISNGTADNFVGADIQGKVTLTDIKALGNTTANSISINLAEAMGIDPNKLAISEALQNQTQRVLTPIRYLQGGISETGMLTMAPTGNSYKDFNPAVMASPVAAQLGGYLTQLNSYDQAFRNMDMYMLMTRKQREAMKLRNKYAAADGNLVFDPTGSAYDDKAVWVRPYATFENVPLKDGPRVSNVAYGSFFGADSELYDLGHGWDGMLSVYAGYNGSHQAYDGIGIYQNGGTLGITGMAYKGNFFTGLTLNAGANVGEANTAYGNDNFTMLMAGIANKTGYNIELADGKFIIQPNVQLSYSFVNTFDYTNAAGVKMNSDPLNAIQVEPGIKFIGNLKNGWQPYAGVSVVWNIMDKTNFHANNVSLPELSVKPYVRYGVGVRKTWGEVCTGFLQTYFTNGGRNGVGIQGGFRFTLGKGGLASIKTSNNMPELPATKIMLSNGGR